MSDREERIEKAHIAFTQHLDWEKDEEHGGIICSECGWSFGEMPVEPEARQLHALRAAAPFLESSPAPDTQQGLPCPDCLDNGIVPKDGHSLPREMVPCGCRPAPDDEARIEAHINAPADLPDEDKAIVGDLIRTAAERMVPAPDEVAVAAKRLVDTIDEMQKGAEKMGGQWYFPNPVLEDRDALRAALKEQEGGA